MLALGQLLSFLKGFVIHSEKTMVYQNILVEAHESFWKDAFPFSGHERIGGTRKRILAEKELRGKTEE